MELRSADNHFLQQQVEQYKRRCDLLEEEVDILKEKLRIDSKGISEYFALIRCFLLTKNEGKMLQLLLKKPLVTRDQFMNELYSDPDKFPELKIVDVFMHKLRAKLKIYKIQVHTIWGVGHSMSQENKNRVKFYLDRQEDFDKKVG